ncbi:hypothetical protein CF326_g3776 [Tilletia indica]|nr:hypothetical protein CF326_g3776 [Tilletia indica]
MSLHTLLRPAVGKLRSPCIRSSFSALEGSWSSTPRRHFVSSSSSRTQPEASNTSSKEKAKAPTLLRSYFYHVDIHGQLFLTETQPKNLTSCFKSIPFLDFFFQRLGPNPALTPPSPDSTSSSAKAKLVQAQRRELEEGALEQGYLWLSPCGPEMNFVKAEATPVVFRELDQDGNLHWAGSFKTRFEPGKMVVDVDTGYLYHPSPSSSSPSPYGEYSLLSSSLVLTHLSSSLEYGDGEGDELGKDAGGGGSKRPAGSVEWEGKRWTLGVKPFSSTTSEGIVK